jgi:heptosyltransferase-3
LRFIGDVLVTTPLALSIKEAIPGARVEYLVFQGTEGVLAKNPYVDRVHTIPRGSSNPRDLVRLFKRFDVALGCNPGDRTVIAASLSGRRSVALSYQRPSQWWTRLALNHRCLYDDSRHVVQQMLALLEPLGIAPKTTVTMAFDALDTSFVRQRLPTTKYVTLHPYSRGGYKYWSARHWSDLAEAILAKTACVPLFTITGDHCDRDFLNAILAQAPKGCHTFPEQFSLSQLAAAIAGGVAYVGIDTVVTHIAAAVGTQVVALFGPTYTRYWAPWPNGCTEQSPFAANKGVQRVGRVTVVQKGWDCVPCNEETCRQSTKNRIECLAELQADEVFQVLRDSLIEDGAL